MASHSMKDVTDTNRPVAALLGRRSRPHRGCVGERECAVPVDDLQTPLVGCLPGTQRCHRLKDHSWAAGRLRLRLRSPASLSHVGGEGTRVPSVRRPMVESTFTLIPPWARALMGLCYLLRPRGRAKRATAVGDEAAALPSCGPAAGDIVEFPTDSRRARSED